MTLVELATLKHGPCTADPNAKTSTEVLRESGLFSVEEMAAFKARESEGLAKYGVVMREGWAHAETAALQEAMDLAVYCAASPHLRRLLSDIEFIMADIQQAIEDKADEEANHPILAPCRGA